MRCPKCGYISFDHLERCKKCKKKVEAVSEVLDGTVFDSPSPHFLKLVLDGAMATSSRPSARPMEEIEINADEDDSASLEIELAEDADASGMEEAVPALDAEPEGEIRLEEIEEVPLREEFKLEFDDEPVAGEIEAADESAAEAEVPEPMLSEPSLDFGDMDISDLAPPEEESEEEVVLAVAEQAEPQAGSGLEDLKIEGIDLGGQQGKQLRVKGVKTGTALDEFDFDLSELLASRKKK